MSEPKTICGFPVDGQGDVTGIPCPFCGSTETQCEPPYEPFNPKVWVACLNDDCGADGPDCKTREEAIEKWLSVEPKEKGKP